MPEHRWQSEREFHDQQASQRARDLAAQDYSFRDEWYVGHESWIAPALAALGDVHGLRVLDLGCGHGMASVVLARRGAHVTACDLSPGYLREARARADANGVRPQLLACNAERLPFADASFPRIWGNAILHHLDMGLAAMELARVLAPGGIAVFCEPWAGNRFLSVARKRLPYPRKDRTRDEHPLMPGDLQCLRKTFPATAVHGYQFFSMLGRVIQQPQVISFLSKCDSYLLRRLPQWQRYCRYVVVIVSKSQ